MLKDALKLLKKIENYGFEAYIVGGYARDLYLKKESIDIDICTNATPRDLIGIFNDGYFSEENYGSLNLKYNNNNYQITTYRKEKEYIDNRYPEKIEYINSLEEDLKRRDFTINTLCIDSNGKYVDIMGAIKDIDNKVIKMVGDPEKRLKEDSLRILRAIRFATILNFEIDNNLKEYIEKYAYLLKNLSFYHKKRELDKIFSSHNKEYGIKLICDFKLNKYLGITNIEKIKPINSLLGIWAQLDVDNNYIFSKNEKEVLYKIKDLLKVNCLNNYHLYRNDLSIIYIVCEIKNISKEIVLIKYQTLPIKSRNDINIKNYEILNILGERYKCKLNQIWIDLENKILSNKIINKKEDIIDYIKNLNIQNDKNKV